jgi:hypothetical protein
MTAGYVEAARTIFLFYPDGLTPVPGGHSCKGHKVPPAYGCSFGGMTGSAACKREIQGFLDRMYAAFDVQFTTTLPAADPFYTIVVNASWPECADSEKENGVADLSCNDYNGNVGYVFNCGASAQACAVTIAHEHAHLVGLEHSNTSEDIMWPHQCTSCDGFVDRPLPIDGKSQCARAEQNSYQMMLTRLGAAPPGVKGGLKCDDETLPGLAILAPDAAVPQGGRTVHVSALATDECGVRFVEFALGSDVRRIHSPPFEADLVMPNAEQLTLTATAEDNVGKRDSATLTFTQDLSQRPAEPPPPSPQDNGCLCGSAPGVSRTAGEVSVGLVLALAAWCQRRRVARH